MKKIRYTCLMALSVLLFQGNLKAQSLSRLLDKIPLEVSPGWYVLPAPHLAYQPETSWSAGGSLVVTRRQNTPGQNRIGTLQLDLIGTLKKQFIADLDFHWPLTDSRWLIAGSLSGSRYPDRYFSPDLPEKFESLSYRRISLDHSLYFSPREALYLGLVARIQRVDHLVYQPDGLFADAYPEGYSGGWSSGLGPGLLYDRRVNPLNPAYGGLYIRAGLWSFSQPAGSQFRFSRMELDLRWYPRLNRWSGAAFQVFAVQQSGDIPFSMKAGLGGSRILRGYHARQFVAANSLAAQSEWRVRLNKNFGWVLFAGFGQAFGDSLASDIRSWHTAAGTGLRITLDQVNLNNLRVDVAYGEMGLTWYFSYGEAF